MEEQDKKKSQVSLTQMLKALDKGVASGLERRLKKLSKKKAIVKPLDKNKADLLERKAAYSSVSKDLDKWESVIEKHKEARQIVFPLDHQPDVLSPTSEALSDLKPRNDLEKEVMGVIESSDSALRDHKELTKAEEKYLKAISLEEAKGRHLELQRMRVLLSSYAAKMRRQKAIKSKSYRRLLKKERLKNHMKKVESNKDLLMDEIEKLRRLRAQERASLKHKNTGKWAKHAKFRAKYDEDARNAMLEQIGIAGKLLERPAEADSDDSDDSEDEVSISEDDVEESPSGNVDEGKPNDDVRDTLIISSELMNNNDDDDDDEDEDDEQHKLISEAFENDDVVAEFKKAKSELNEQEQPKDIQLYLPGWNDWAGPGIKVNRRKKSKYKIKAKKLPRRDDNLGNVIISEQAEDKIRELQLRKVPRGLKDEDQLTKKLCKPTAATFINQSVYKNKTRPKIVSKLGARIEPMSQKLLKSNKAKWLD